MNKNKSIKIMTAFLLIICITLSFCGCTTKSSTPCVKHQGVECCEKCDLVYYDELAKIIKSKANSTENGTYEILAQTENIDAIIKYDSTDDRITCSLVYLQHQYSPVIFILTIAPQTGTTYGWAMGTSDKIANGTFNSEELNNLIFKPEIENNDFSEKEFSELTSIYEESVSFCVDMIHSLLAQDNTNNLTIADLGFVNYTPNITV